MALSDVKGLVLRIERSSIHDGHGLRTVLFLKGCALSCLWCSTPESQKKSLEAGYVADRCAGCGSCAANCPENAISVESNSIITDAIRCSGCLTCVAVCPRDARQGYGRVLTVAQALAEISKDEIFFYYSGGGVTLSGGECLLQPEFAAGVLQGCRQRGINTAVETSLYSPWPNVERILPFVNTFYIDLKHHDSRRHKQLTGVKNERILANLNMLDHSEIPFGLHIRIPLIPGINDSDDVLAATTAIAAALTKIQAIEILPYHRLGVATYARLGRKYRLGTVAAPSQEYLVERAAFLRALNLPVPVLMAGQCL
ncbi:MAG: glycyl-radical enzyme activating protein [Desulforhopalus sp.]